MKPICILLYLLSLAACFGDHFKDAMIKQAPDVNLAGTLPERYDWLNYIDPAKSVSGEMLRAWAAVAPILLRSLRSACSDFERCRARLPVLGR
jgi:hypothetical protein